MEPSECERVPAVGTFALHRGHVLSLSNLFQNIRNEQKNRRSKQKKIYKEYEIPFRNTVLAKNMRTVQSDRRAHFFLAYCTLVSRFQHLVCGGIFSILLDRYVRRRGGQEGGRWKRIDTYNFTQEVSTQRSTEQDSLLVHVVELDQQVHERD